MSESRDDPSENVQPPMSVQLLVLHSQHIRIPFTDGLCLLAIGRSSRFANLQGATVNISMCKEEVSESSWCVWSSRNG